ncbi:hypothetical protein DERF_006772 [Dermatophagoides farinae]|uniref:Uncharacterized protein n=1 Tax=Dermatophagoides farinae TaxID=6954 RepID=A0A922HZ38_DERFA|nr:hypothetical protein DERF_006772 [Dermatophagoides farinae]
MLQEIIFIFCCKQTNKNQPKKLSITVMVSKASSTLLTQCCPFVNMAIIHGYMDPNIQTYIHDKRIQEFSNNDDDNDNNNNNNNEDNMIRLYKSIKRKFSSIFGRPGKSRGLVQCQLEKREALKKLRNFQKMIA